MHARDKVAAIGESLKHVKAVDARWEEEVKEQNRLGAASLVGKVGAQKVKDLKRKKALEDSRERMLKKREWDALSAEVRENRAKLTHNTNPNMFPMYYRRKKHTRSRH